MLKADVIAHFESAAKVARALQISPVAVHRWGPVVPYHSAEEVERVTDGALRRRRELYRRGKPLRDDDLARVLRREMGVPDERQPAA